MTKEEIYSSRRYGRAIDLLGLDDLGVNMKKEKTKKCL